MNSHATPDSSCRIAPSLQIALLLYLGYLAIFYATWALNDVDYLRIGESVESTRLWYAYPTLLGCSFLVIALSVLGWWRAVLFETPISMAPRWLWTLPAAMAAIIAGNFAKLPFSSLPAELLLWSVLGAIGVGFGEEMITRGSLIVGLRTRYGETHVWLISCLLFSAMHIPNIAFGLPWWAMPVQVVLTFVMGSAFYLLRRLSGTLLLCMVLHGLWDSSLFLTIASGQEASGIQFAIYPLAIVCIIVLLRRQGEQP